MTPATRTRATRSTPFLAATREADRAAELREAAEDEVLALRTLSSRLTNDEVAAGIVESLTAAATARLTAADLEARRLRMIADAAEEATGR